MKKILTRISLALSLVIVLAIIAFYSWAIETYEPSEELREFVQLDEVMRVDDALVFEPDEAVRSGVGLVLYPGAKVDRAAYSYYAQQLMNEGVTVVIPTMRLNFALFSPNVASAYIEQFSHVERWIVGGHSLGGVAAAMFAAEHEVDGLVLLAAYSSDGTDLREATFPVLSLSAEYDGLTTRADIEASKERLPAQTMFVEIAGGNHAQFGMYGAQKGDGTATISVIEQQQAMVTHTLQWLLYAASVDSFDSNNPNVCINAAPI